MPDCCVSYPRTGKRLFDFLVVLIAIVLISPILLLIALLIKITDNGPVLFSQERIGLNSQPFTLYKYRSMRPMGTSEGPAVTAKGDARITPIGRLLRKTKLDELPQLFNVLIGDMSLVGPRPEVGRYVDMFRDDYKTVLSVRPGITDYAAIEYRNEEAVLARDPDPQEAYAKEILPAKILLYKKYIAELSFLTDLTIIVRTLGKLVG